MHKPIILRVYYVNGLKKKQEAIDNYKKFLQYAKPDDISIDMVKKSIKELEQELN